MKQVAAVRGHWPLCESIIENWRTSTHVYAVFHRSHVNPEPPRLTCSNRPRTGDSWRGRKAQPVSQSPPSLSVGFARTKASPDHCESRFRYLATSSQDQLQSLSTLLCGAAARGDLTALREVLGNEGAHVNLADYDKRTAIHLACSEGLEHVVRCLVDELGADINPVDRWGNTPLDDALRARHTNVVTFLKTRGAKADGMRGDSASRLRLTEGEQLTDAVLASWARVCFHAAQGSLDGVKAEMIKLAGSDDEDAICTALRFYDGDYDRRTPLHLAASEGCYTVAVWLLDNGSPKDVVDRFGNTPLMCALQSQNHEVVELMVQRGCRVLAAKGPAKGTLVGLEDSSRGSGILKSLLKSAAVDWEISPGELRIIRPLGEGGCAQVHLGVWRGTPVAVKDMKIAGDLEPYLVDIVKREFRQEVNRMARLHHPNIVQFLGASLHEVPHSGDNLRLVLEYMERGSLADAFKEPRPPLQQRLAWAIDVARGMTYLHMLKPQAVVHRDLKPENVMLFLNGRAKVADFGLSKTLPALDRLSSSSALPPPGPMDGSVCLPDLFEDAGFDVDGHHWTEAAGTYRYMAPEVFLGETYNHTIDVYSFALILYQLLFWIRPFQNLGCEEAARLASSKSNPLRPQLPSLEEEPEVSQDMRQLVECAWSPDTRARPPFIAMLEKLQAEHDRLFGHGPAL